MSFMFLFIKFLIFTEMGKKFFKVDPELPEMDYLQSVADVYYVPCSKTVLFRGDNSTMDKVIIWEIIRIEIIEKVESRVLGQNLYEFKCVLSIDFHEFGRECLGVFPNNPRGLIIACSKMYFDLIRLAKCPSVNYIMEALDLVKFCTGFQEK